MADSSEEVQSQETNEIIAKTPVSKDKEVEKKPNAS